MTVADVVRAMGVGLVVAAYSLILLAMFAAGFFVIGVTVALPLSLIPGIGQTAVMIATWLWVVATVLAVPAAIGFAVHLSQLKR